MNVGLQRKLDRYLGKPMCALCSLIAPIWTRRMPDPSSLPPKTILVILLSEMGSVVQASPMFEKLAQTYPDASVYVLMFKKNREILELLDIVPGENVLTLDDRTLSGFIADSVSIIKQFTRIKLDVVLDCELFSRASSIFSFLSRAPIRVGFYPHTQEGLYRGSFINRRQLYNPYQHISRQFLTLVDSISSRDFPPPKVQSVDAPIAPPKVSIPPEEIQTRIGALHRDYPALQNRDLVLIYPSGGILSIRAWPIEYYAQVSASLLDTGFAVAIIGLKEDRPMADRIRTHSPNPALADLTGYTENIRHLLCLMHSACLLITNDGGPAQFAVVTPISTIVLFGPETSTLYAPLGQSTHCMQIPISCSPCLTAYNHRNSPCDGDNQCLKRIRPEQVLEKALELTSRKPPTQVTDRL